MVDGDFFDKLETVARYDMYDVIYFVNINILFRDATLQGIPWIPVFLVNPPN